MSVSVRLLIALVVCALIADVLFAFRNINALLLQERNISASYVRLNTLERTLTAITDAETGQRGFLITGKEEYLAPYDNARHTIDARPSARSATRISELLATLAMAST